VIKNREKAGNEDDGRQTWKANEKAKLGDFFWLADVAEYERRTDVGIAEKFIGAVTEECKNRASGGGTQNENTQQELQTQSQRTVFNLMALRSVENA